MMNVKHKADCEQPPATIDFMNWYFKLATDSCDVPQKYKNILFRDRSNPASAARSARSRPCGWLVLDAPIQMKKYHIMKGIKIGIFIEIIID
jgi:hypothetical protein